jgi:hypothetical protein
MTDIDKTIEEAKAEILPFESWERLTGESAGAYAAFCAYRDFGPDRNIRKAVEASCDEAGAAAKAAKRYRVWRSWSTQFRWRERAADYDQYLDRLKQTERRKTIEAQEEVYRRATGKMLEVVQKKLDCMAPGELAQDAVVDWLTAAISTEREIAGLDPVGAGRAGTRGKREDKGQLEINFSPDFEGL